MSDRIDGYTLFNKSPEPNCEIRVGDNPLDQGVVLNLYLENPPNRFQRWMMKVCLGLYWRALK
jgi:hypothetical protein